MKTRIAKKIKHSLLIEENDLIELDKFLHSKYFDIEITAQCADGSSLETKNLEDILAFENPNFRKIHSITYEAKNEYMDSLSVDIGDTRVSLFGTAAINLQSENDEKATFVTGELIKRLKEMKPSYDWITYIDFTLFVFLIWGVYSLVYSTLKVFGVLPPLPPTQFSTMEEINTAFVIAGIVFLVTYPIGKGINYLFPKVFFLLGRQKKNFESILKWRNIVFVGIILAIMTGIVGNAISQQLLGK